MTRLRRIVFEAGAAIAILSCVVLARGDDGGTSWRPTFTAADQKWAVHTTVTATLKGKETNLGVLEYTDAVFDDEASCKKFLALDNPDFKKANADLTELIEAHGGGDVKLDFACRPYGSDGVNGSGI